MKKNDKVFLLFFIGIVTFSMLYLFQSAYAKYRKQINGQVEATVASWNIKVNNETINNKTTLTNVMTPVIEANQYVKQDVIAPGTTGYFDIVINALEADVDFTFELSTETDENAPLSDLRFTKYSINGVEHSYSQDGTLTGNIAKNTGDTSIRVYFQWYDGADNNMSNVDDTMYATNANNTTTNIIVSIHFTQIT